MFRILDTKELAPSIKQFMIDAPLVAQKLSPGSSLFFASRKVEKESAYNSRPRCTKGYRDHSIPGSG